MRVVYGGDTIDLYVSWTSEGSAYDPPDTTVNIVRNFVNVVYGPFTYSDGRVTRNGPGEYQLQITIDDFLVPGNYTAKWEADIEGNPTVFTETFVLGEPEPEQNELLDPPRLYGKMRESHRYDVMGVGLTDTIFLVGHADGIGINSPYQVKNIKEAVSAIGGDIACPLLRAMLEAYNAGARDIWLVAAAPMSEYIPVSPVSQDERFVERDIWGGATFYERYKQRLEATYLALNDWENIQILVPVEAPYYNSGGVDFFFDMAYNCYLRFVNTGFVSIGILGTQIGAWTAEDLEAMKNSDLIQGVGDFSREAFIASISETNEAILEDIQSNIPHKFGMIAFGEGSFTLPQVPNTYSGPVAATLAGMLASSDLKTGLVYRELPNVINPIGNDLSKDQVKELARVRINPLIRKVQGRRGKPYKTVMATDNLFMADGSDFWSITQMRLVGKVINEIKLLGNRAIGTIAYEAFKRQVYEMLDLLVTSNTLRGYSINFYRRPAIEDPNQTVYVNLGLTPYTNVRELFFVVEVGPGA